MSDNIESIKLKDCKSCTYCVKCISCVSCISCFQCQSATKSTYCNKSNFIIECHWCENMTSSVACLKCNHCESCSGCTDCNYCEGCTKSTGLYYCKNVRGYNINPFIEYCEDKLNKNDLISLYKNFGKEGLFLDDKIYIVIENILNKLNSSYYNYHLFEDYIYKLLILSKNICYYLIHERLFPIDLFPNEIFK